MIATITSGLYRGVSGILRRRFVVNNVEYADLETSRGIYVVRVDQLDICDEKAVSS